MLTSIKKHQFQCFGFCVHKLQIHFHHITFIYCRAWLNVPQRAWLNVPQQPAHHFQLELNKISPSEIGLDYVKLRLNMMLSHNKSCNFSVTPCWEQMTFPSISALFTFYAKNDEKLNNNLPLVAIFSFFGSKGGPLIT